MQAPGPDPTRQGRGDVHLQHGQVDLGPGGPSHLGHGAVLVGDRSGGSEAQAVDRRLAQLTVGVDRRVLRVPGRRTPRSSVSSPAECRPRRTVAADGSTPRLASPWPSSCPPDLVAAPGERSRPPRLGRPAGLEAAEPTPPGRPGSMPGPPSHPAARHPPVVAVRGLLRRVRPDGGGGRAHAGPGQRQAGPAAEHHRPGPAGRPGARPGPGRPGDRRARLHHHRRRHLPRPLSQRQDPGDRPARHAGAPRPAGDGAQAGRAGPGRPGLAGPGRDARSRPSRATTTTRP